LKDACYLVPTLCVGTPVRAAPQRGLELPAAALSDATQSVRGVRSRAERGNEEIRTRGLIAGMFLVVVLLVPVQAGEPPAIPTRVAHFRDFIQHLSWSPDGKKFLFTRIHAGKMAVWTMNQDGSELKQLLAANSEPHFDGSWSPDSKKIVFVYDHLEGTDGKLRIDVIDADGSGRKTLIPHLAFEESPRWSPDGRLVAWVSTRDKDQNIYVIGADGKNPRRLTSDLAPDNNPSWSPDGRQIAFCSGRAGNLQIFAMNADGGNVRRLTHQPRMDYWPVWSPDGKRIAFTSNRDGNYEIYAMNADGTGQRNLTGHPAQDNYATWSPDGRRLAFISNRGGGYGIYVMDIK
jgi:TolB protein